MSKPADDICSSYIPGVGSVPFENTFVETIVTASDGIYRLPSWGEYHDDCITRQLVRFFTLYGGIVTYYDSAMPITIGLLWSVTVRIRGENSASEIELNMRS